MANIYIFLNDGQQTIFRSILTSVEIQAEASYHGYEFKSSTLKFAIKATYASNYQPFVGEKVQIYIDGTLFGTFFIKSYKTSKYYLEVYATDYITFLTQAGNIKHKEYIALEDIPTELRTPSGLIVPTEEIVYVEDYRARHTIAECIEYLLPDNYLEVTGAPDVTVTGIFTEGDLYNILQQTACAHQCIITTINPAGINFVDNSSETPVEISSEQIYGAWNIESNNPITDLKLKTHYPSFSVNFETMAGAHPSSPPSEWWITLRKEETQEKVFDNGSYYFALATGWNGWQEQPSEQYGDYHEYLKATITPGAEEAHSYTIHYAMEGASEGVYYPVYRLFGFKMTFATSTYSFSDEALTHNTLKNEKSIDVGFGTYESDILEVIKDDVFNYFNHKKVISLTFVYNPSVVIGHRVQFDISGITYTGIVISMHMLYYGNKIKCQSKVVIESEEEAV